MLGQEGQEGREGKERLVGRSRSFLPFPPVLPFLPHQIHSKSLSINCQRQPAFARRARSDESVDQQA
jgi:hypothetical protein